MARTQVQSELIATNAISGTIIADNAITATHIATNSISGTLVQDGGIVTTMIANNNVTATKIVTDAIQTRHIANDQVTGDKLTDNITIAGTLTSTGAFTSPGIDDNADATAITIDSSENIGIGMGADGSYGRIAVNSSGTQVALRASSGTARLGFFEAGAGRFYLQTLDGADGLRFVDGDGSTEHMRITAAGNVGIGIASPATTLHLDASGGAVMRLQRTSANATNKLELSHDGTDGTITSTNDLAISATNVGIGDTNPQHPLKVHLTNGQIAMFGSNGMNSTGQYAGIGLGQVLANNTTYQKIQIVAEGRDSGSYVSNLHFLVDIAADSGSAVLADSKMMLSGENGFLGVGLTDPKSRAEFHLDQVAAATNVTTSSVVHFGSQQHTDGAMMGITLGYRESSMNYRKVGVFARGRGDNAARQDLLLCVDTVSDGGSVRDTDAKITINGTTGECKIGNTTAETETYCLKVQTQHGYGRQGSANSSYFHHETDRSYNYWNEAGYFSGGAHTYSDETLKKDVVVIPDALASVAKMNGVTFKWKDPENRGGKGTGKGKQFGVIAQNMLEVDPELPTLSVDPLAESGNEETDDKLYSMDYARLSPYFIEAIKELKTKLEAAEAKIAALESK